MATVWWWVVTPSEASASTRPSDAKLISTPDSGTDYDSLLNGGTVSGYVRFQGPFQSQSAAQNAPGAGSTADVIAAGLGAASVPGSGVAGAIGTGVDGISAIGASLHTFVSAITDGKLWRSLGWVILGIFLLLLGIGLWLGKDAVKAIPLAGAVL